MEQLTISQVISTFLSGNRNANLIEAKTKEGYEKYLSFRSKPNGNGNFLLNSVCVFWISPKYNGKVYKFTLLSDAIDYYNSL